jgi:hypothetical protein
MRSDPKTPDSDIPAITPGPWDYVPSNEHHGPYVTSDFGSTICDCYTMSNPTGLSVRNGGDSKPVPFMWEMADPNARLIAAAPELLEALLGVLRVADRKTVEFDAARAAIAKATGAS